MTDRPFAPDRRTFTRLAAALALSALPVIGRASAPRVRAVTGRAFATSWRLVLPETANADAARAAIDAATARVDTQMSPWRPDSILSSVNRAEAGAVGLPDDLAAVTSAALDLARTTRGAFDPTVGPLVARWGFGPISGDADGRWTDFDIAGDRLDKRRAGATLDLCGIAKGYALDLAARGLASIGIDDFLLDIGGELLAAGRHPAGRAWQAAVEDPRLLAEDAAGVLALDNMAVATSGTRWNRLSYGATSWSHIIAPGTRRPVSGQPASVTVVARTAMKADGWATALLAAGPERGPDLAARHDIAALFLTGDERGLLRHATPAFGAYALG